MNTKLFGLLEVRIVIIAFIMLWSILISFVYQPDENHRSPKEALMDLLKPYVESTEMEMNFEVRIYEEANGKYSSSYGAINKSGTYYYSRFNGITTISDDKICLLINDISKTIVISNPISDEKRSFNPSIVDLSFENTKVSTLNTGEGLAGFLVTSTDKTYHSEFEFSAVNGHLLKIRNQFKTPNVQGIYAIETIYSTSNPNRLPKERILDISEFVNKRRDGYVGKNGYSSYHILNHLNESK